MTAPEIRDEAVRTDGVEIRASVVGSGRPLVLCHGGPGLWDNLEDLARLLAPLFTVWTYDQRGCGRSTGTEGPFTLDRFVDDLDAVRRATGRERIVVGGHSWGAVLALLYASSHPEHTLGVLYVAGVGIEWPKWKPQHNAEHERRSALTPYVEMARATRHPHVVRWAIDFANPAIGRQRAEAMAASGHAVNTECNKGLNQELNAISADEWAARCRRVEVPVVVVQGGDDPRPVDAVDSMLSLLPNAKRLVLQGAGHYPWVERPGEFRTTVWSWAKGLAEDRAESAPFANARF